MGDPDHPADCGCAARSPPTPSRPRSRSPAPPSPPRRAAGEGSPATCPDRWSSSPDRSPQQPGSWRTLTAPGGNASDESAAGSTERPCGRWPGNSCISSRSFFPPRQASGRVHVSMRRADALPDNPVCGGRAPAGAAPDRLRLASSAQRLAETEQTPIKPENAHSHTHLHSRLHMQASDFSCRTCTSIRIRCAFAPTAVSRAVTSLVVTSPGVPQFGTSDLHTSRCQRPDNRWYRHLHRHRSTSYRLSITQDPARLSRCIHGER